MKIQIFGGIMLLFGLGLAAEQAMADTSSLANADNTFAFKLLQQLSHDQPGENIFISPYSAATALQMCGNGAANQTREEMRQTLHLTKLSDPEINAANKVIIDSLNQNTNVILNTANSLWGQNYFPFLTNFLTVNRNYFDATVQSVNFSDPATVNIINDWASEKTHGRITHIADGMIDPKNTALFLANAVYFKGKWEDPFDANDTQDKPFHLRNGTDKTVPMMLKKTTFTYRHGSGYQAVRLPYLDDNLAMYVFLPETNSSPEKLLNILTGDKWRRITKPGFMNDVQGTLVLPRFKLDYDVDLVSPLKSLGMKMAFDNSRADFSGITSDPSALPIWISDVVQKTFVEVKEEGTEAAAGTGIDMIAGGIPEPDQFQMIVDRPFLFLIEDDHTGVILFMGVVYDPQPN